MSHIDCDEIRSLIVEEEDVNSQRKRALPGDDNAQGPPRKRRRLNHLPPVPATKPDQEDTVMEDVSETEPARESLHGASDVNMEGSGFISDDGSAELCSGPLSPWFPPGASQRLSNHEFTQNMDSKSAARGM